MRAFGKTRFNEGDEGAHLLQRLASLIGYFGTFVFLESDTLRVRVGESVSSRRNTKLVRSWFRISAHLDVGQIVRELSFAKRQCVPGLAGVLEIQRHEVTR